MRQTLCYFPHELFGIPLFGMGLVLGVWVLVSIGLMINMIRRGRVKEDLGSYLSVVVVVAAIAVLLLPRLEATTPAGDPLGIPIRGYGLFLLAGMLAGVGLAASRAKRQGVSPEAIFSLAFWCFLSGIAGARLFYVIQKWEQFAQGGLWSVVNMTEGGLVVYGSLLVALPVGLWHVRRMGLPLLAMADLMAPSMVLGLALGRIGCLMNGCCYGGLCEAPWAVTFPQYSSSIQQEESPPYHNQHRHGLLHGIRIAPDDQGWPYITKIDPQGAAAHKFANALRTANAEGELETPIRIIAINGINFADEIERIQKLNNQTIEPIDVAYNAMGHARNNVMLTTEDHRAHLWEIETMPSRSLPIHPTQIYSSLNAFVLFLIVNTFYAKRRRDGEVICLLLVLYSITRFLLEVIRTDEGSIFGTGLTISQNVSLGVLIVTLVFYFIYLRKQPTGSAFPLPQAE